MWDDRLSSALMESCCEMIFRSFSPKYRLWFSTPLKNGLGHKLLLMCNQPWDPCSLAVWMPGSHHIDSFFMETLLVWTSLLQTAVALNHFPQMILISHPLKPIYLKYLIGLQGHCHVSTYWSTMTVMVSYCNSGGKQQCQCSKVYVMMKTNIKKKKKTRRKISENKS